MVLDGWMMPRQEHGRGQQTTKQIYGCSVQVIHSFPSLPCQLEMHWMQSIPQNQNAEPHSEQIQIPIKRHRASSSKIGHPEIATAFVTSSGLGIISFTSKTSVSNCVYNVKRNTCKIIFKFASQASDIQPPKKLQSVRAKRRFFFRLAQFNAKFGTENKQFHAIEELRLPLLETCQFSALFCASNAYRVSKGAREMSE